MKIEDLTQFPVSDSAQYAAAVVELNRRGGASGDPLFAAYMAGAAAAGLDTPGGRMRFPDGAAQLINGALNGQQWAQNDAKKKSPLPMIAVGLAAAKLGGLL